MPVAILDGFEMYYRVAGTGEPVVYVHGGFPSLESALLDLPRDGTDWGWEHDCSDQFQFVSYDRRGCYRSSCPEDGYGLLEMVEDLELLLDDLGIPSVHLIGSFCRRSHRHRLRSNKGAKDKVSDLGRYRI